MIESRDMTEFQRSDLHKRIHAALRLIFNRLVFRIAFPPRQVISTQHVRVVVQILHEELTNRVAQPLPVLILRDPPDLRVQRLALHFRHLVAPFRLGEWPFAFQRMT